MRGLAGLMLTLIVSGCVSPVHQVFTKETTLVVMEPISLTDSKEGSPVRFREVDGSCQYLGKIGTDNKAIWWADIDTEFCYPESRNPGTRSVSVVISLGKLTSDVERNSSINVRYNQL
jgi:hypothetical protein